MIGLCVLVVGGMAGVAWMQVRSEEMQEQVLQPALPDSEHPVPIVEDAPLPNRLPGRVTIDLRGGEFTLVPAPAGERLRVDATYDPDQFELVESVENLGDDGWAYEVRFHGPGTSLVTALRKLFGGSTPKIRIQIPVDVPIALELRVEQGGGEADLGGMWLTTADVTLEKGGMAMSIDTPLRAPMESFSFTGSMGGMAVEGLGNASPAKLTLDFSMGGFAIDMRGEWQQDCEIDVAARMGGGEIVVPRDVRVVGLSDLIGSPSEPGEDPRPTLTFTPGSQLDDVEVRRR